MPDDLSTWRISVHSDDESHPNGGVELVGKLVGTMATLQDFAKAMKPFGIVLASPMEPTDD